MGLRPSGCTFGVITCEEREEYFASTLDRILGGDLYPRSSGSCVNGSGAATLGLLGTEHLDIEVDQRRQYVTRLFSECGDDIARDLTRAILGLAPDPEAIA
jgi:hypothetical protein